MERSHPWVSTAQHKEIIMRIWLREDQCEWYILCTVDSLDGLVYDETGQDGIPCYHKE